MQSMLHLMPDNVMFETDYPHPTSLSPGPASVAENPRIVLDKALGGLPDELVRKVVFEYAARVYHLRSEEHPYELQSLMRISYAVFCLKQQPKHTELLHHQNR